MHNSSHKMDLNKPVQFHGCTCQQSCTKNGHCRSKFSLLALCNVTVYHTVHKGN